MTMRNSPMWQRNWRIVTVAVLGAVLAFVGSFLVQPTFEASTRLLIHGRDATFLSSTGQDLTTQPGVVDSQLSQSLAGTYAGIATSRTVASAVVDQLHLDSPSRSDGLVSTLAKGFAWVYRCSRAFVTSGYCADVDPYEKAVTEVQEGTAVAPLATNSGASAGQGASYVLEITSSGHSPQEAKEVTDAVATELVATSQARYTEDAQRSLKALQAQLASASKDVGAASTALAKYQTQHGISAADGKLALSAGTYESLRADLLKAQAEEADLRAQLTSIIGSLSSIPKSAQSSQRIVTGRSTTQLNSSNANTVYNDLLTQQRTTQASLDGQVARVRQLRNAVDGSAPLSNNATLAGMTGLESQLELAQKNQADLAASVQQARTSQAQGPVGLTRIDTAAQPPYPSEPKRYIYLALGLLLGALAGAGLTVWARRHEPDAAVDTAEGGPAGGAGGAKADPDLFDELSGSPRPVTQWPEPVPAPSLAGPVSGNGHRPVTAPRQADGTT
ncbi:MAG: Wzz/FepE/Etk N-terminal domain-containing protein [Humibacillus sp.]